MSEDLDEPLRRQAFLRVMGLTFAGYGICPGCMRKKTVFAPRRDPRHWKRALPGLLEDRAMSHERLGTLMQAHQDALRTHPEAHATHETILSILRALVQGDITTGRAVSLLGYQAVHWADDPAQTALYRQAAADLRRMQREEHGR